MKTRKELEGELTALGVSGDALEVLLWETGQERHRFRVQAAITAAEEYYLKVSGLDRDESSPEFLRVAAGAILWADHIGIGGRDNCEGSSTLRHPALRGCGKGRKQATDGDAWNAAVMAACDELQKQNPRFAVLDGPILVYEDATAQIQVDEGLFEKRWLHAIAREGLRRATGLPRWHQNVPFKAPPESAPIWAALVNQFLANPEDLSREILHSRRYTGY